MSETKGNQSKKHLDHVYELTKRVNEFLGDDVTKTITEEQGRIFDKHINDLVRAAQADYVADTILAKTGSGFAQEVGKVVNKELSTAVAEQTLLAYRNWRWWADRAATGAIMTVAAVGTLAAGKFVTDRVRKRSTTTTSDNPFNDNVAGFKASPRPAARAPKEQPNLQNMMQ